MNILKEVLKAQVYPAFGCTEPVSVALCAATAAKALGKRPESMKFVLDAATYKNGMAVNIPNTGGKKGNLLAGVLGALVGRPELGMEVLSAAPHAAIGKAERLISLGRAGMAVSPAEHTGIYIRAELRCGKDHAVCVVSSTHTHVSLLSVNGRTMVSSRLKGGGAGSRLEKDLAGMKLRDLVGAAETADRDDLEYIRKGVLMNLAVSEAGGSLGKVGSCLLDLKRKGRFADDVFSSTKILVACATDARMHGLPLPVMSSGESGNQGIVATLAPYNAGKIAGVGEDRIYRSIALSHLLNAYVKTFTGSLAPVCGCAIGAGVGASAAIVYQTKGADIKAITLAINNLVSDIGGMLCDGAKSGCALKVVSAADSAIRSAYMAIYGYGITDAEGFVGTTAEATIQNLAKISNTGMGKVDSAILEIMHGKAGARAKNKRK